MREKVILYFTLLVAIITIVQCQEDGVKKPNPLLRRAAGRNTFTKTTTTTPSPILDEYEDEIDENGEYIDGDQGAVENSDATSTTTSTTEPAKKIGPIIRPFRSNDDLLSALKRRQQNMKSIKKVTSKPFVDEPQEKEVAPVSPSKPTANKSIDRHSITAKKNRFGNARVPSVAEQQDTQPPAEEVTPTVKRPARSRFGFNRSN
ncbi:hypothetical protein Bhyg_11810 [Pseudolycoriella hygida]|uniref:Uncharacterized protein n=1 Tax=Pseudolycoriella hygida TaxID=35572 RepID=A0A9Q0MW19_9DIPT|nr:hypothetical protein Bhyg_11810 [Pseudolycoriella hygida]